jgi:hypothetical protein
MATQTTILTKSGGGECRTATSLAMRSADSVDHNLNIYFARLLQSLSRLTFYQIGHYLVKESGRGHLEGSGANSELSQIDGFLSNDVRSGVGFADLVRFILGETGVPYDWEYESCHGDAKQREWGSFLNRGCERGSDEARIDRMVHEPMRTGVDDMVTGFHHPSPIKDDHGNSTAYLRAMLQGFMFRLRRHRCAG